MFKNKSLEIVFNSERGLTLLEIMVTLVIVCMFAVVVTQFMGISFKDIFDKGSKMQAATTAQNLMEKITAIIENSNDTTLDESLTGLDEYIDADELLVYDTAKPVRFYYERPVFKDIDDSDDTPDVEGIDVDVVVFYNNGANYIRIDNFIFTG